VLRQAQHERSRGAVLRLPLVTLSMSKGNRHLFAIFPSVEVFSVGSKGLSVRFPVGAYNHTLLQFTDIDQEIVMHPDESEAQFN
jgi:hypothetical protein